MSVLLVAAAGMLGLFLLLGLYGGKGGPSETAPAPAVAQGHWIARLGPEGLEKLLQRLFAAMGLVVEESEVHGGRLDMIALDRSAIGGGRLHVRGLTASDSGMIGQAEVQAALDAARGGGSVKAVVVSPLGFSAEARAAVASTPCDLVDADALIALLERHLPDALESAGAGYV